jgi:amino acid transporter
VGFFSVNTRLLVKGPAIFFLIKLANHLFSILGFDASAHLSEETQRASWSAPIGVLMSIGVSAVFGFFLILCLLFSIQDFDATVSTDTNYGQPVFKIFVDVFGENGALVLITLIILCVWHCGNRKTANPKAMQDDGCIVEVS